MTSRWIIAGAGAVGGTIGARLIDAGARVVLVARGAHADAIERAGLVLEGAHGRLVTHPTELWRPGEGQFQPGDRVIVAVKSNDTIGLIQQFEGWDRPEAVICAQNGVLNEPAFVETGATVLGAMVWMPALHLDPGLVESHATPDGFLAIGRWPQGSVHDPLLHHLVSDLARCGLAAEAVTDVRRWKLGKLMTNLGNAIDALVVQGQHKDLVRAVRHEGAQVLAAAGLDAMPMSELIRTASPLLAPTTALRPRPGGSTWQSLTRGSRGLEVAYLNGYIVDLAAKVGLQAPLNARLVEVAEAYERGEVTGRSIEPAALLG